MHPEPSRDATRWLDQATEDLAAAGKLREIGIHYAACFFAQQAAEKALKAALLALELVPSRTHAVTELAEALASCDVGAPGLVSEIGMLDQYYIPTRYPDALPGSIPARVYGGVDSERALAMAERALEVARAVASRP